MIILRNKKGFTLAEAFITSAIVGLFLAAAFAFLNTTQRANQVNDTQLRAEEYAKAAMDRILTELRIANPETVLAANALGLNATEINPGSGSCINFQIPVGIYDNNLVFDDNDDDGDGYTDELVWGTNATAGNSVAFYVDGGSSQLLRAEVDKDGSGVSVPVASHIDAVSFTKVGTIPNVLIMVSVTSRVDGPSGPVIHTLQSQVRLRNYPPQPLAE